MPMRAFAIIVASVAALGGCNHLPDETLTAVTPTTRDKTIENVLADIARSEGGVLKVYVRDPSGPRLFLGTILPNQRRSGKWNLLVVQDAHDPAIRVICRDTGPPDGVTEGCVLETLRTELDRALAQRMYEGILKRLENPTHLPPTELGT